MSAQITFMPGIMPWPLLYLDQTVSMIHFDDSVAQTLVRYARPLSMWFGRAAGRKHKEVDNGGIAGIFVGISYKDVSSVCHIAKIVPQLLEEHELYRYRYM